MAKRLPQMSSGDASFTFKTKISESLCLLGFLESQEKEKIWRFWRTVSSAVKIAVNGKGDFVDTPRTSKHSKKGQIKSENDGLQHLDQNLITVYVPNKDLVTSQSIFRILKLANDEKIADYFDTLALESEDYEVQGSNKDEKENSNVASTDNNISAQVAESQADLRTPSSEVETEDLECDHDGFNSTQYTTKVDKNPQNVPSHSNIKLQEKVAIRGSKSKASKLVWPVGRPTTRGLSRTSKENGKCVQTTVSPNLLTTDCTLVKTEIESGADNVVDSSSNLNGIHAESSAVSMYPPHMKEETLRTAEEDFNITLVPVVDNVLQLNHELQNPQGNNDDLNMYGIDVKVDMNSCNNVDNSSNFSDIFSSNSFEPHEAIDAVVERTMVPANPNHTVTVAYPDSQSDVKKLSSAETDLEVGKCSTMMHTTDHTIQGTLAQRNASDIETIISALEEELKKTGSSVATISVTPSNANAVETMMINNSGDTMYEGAGSAHQVHIVNTQLENVIWTSMGEIRIVEENQDGNTNMAIMNPDRHPVEAGYDVVECEVLADKQMKRGRKKKVKSVASGLKQNNLDRTCPMCHRVLHYASSMAAHMRTHTGVKPYSCGQCDRKFTTKANRDRHEATHVGLKPFQCSACSKCFTEKRSLNVHMRTHTGERPFVCQVCGRGFTQKCTLRVHMDRHTNKKGHLCDLCGKAFRQKCQLDIHVMRHNRQAAFPCKECSTKCYTKGDLMRHMIKHTGERPFQCNECPRAFTRKQYLIDHINVHYGRKPYQCSVCAATFHDMGSCHRHLRKHKMEVDGITKGKEQAAVLSSKDFHRMLKGTQIGQILKLEDGTDAVVKAVVSEADGSTVYHITCLKSSDSDKIAKTSGHVAETVLTSATSTVPTHSLM